MSDHILEKRHNRPPPPQINLPLPPFARLLSGRKHVILKSRRPGFKTTVQPTTYCLCMRPCVMNTFEHHLAYVQTWNNSVCLMVDVARMEENREFT